MRHLASLIFLAIICTVNYPSDCTLVDTKFSNDETKYKAQVVCSYVDGSRSLYFATAKKTASGKMTRVDYLPSDLLTDSATMTCQ